MNRRLLIGPALALSALTLFVYARTWSFEMLRWDDDVNVLENPLVTQPFVAGMKQIFTSTFSTDYYPLTYVSLAVDHAVWREQFWGYHVTQTLLHSANVFLVALLIWRLTRSSGVALLTSAWFSFHPVQVETVAWVAERKNVLGTCFFLLTWLAYLRSGEPLHTPRWRFAALAFCTLAVLSHALMIVLPLLLLAYEIMPRRATLAEALRRTWLYFVPSIFAAVMRVIGHQQSGQLRWPFRSATEGVLTMIKVVGCYFRTLVWPTRLSNHYTVRVVDSLADVGLWVGVLWFAAWAALIWRARSTRQWSAWAVAWFFVCLAPVLQLIPHPTVQADRYLYIAPLMAFVFGALVLEKRRALIALAGPVSAACLLALTLERIPVWRNAKTLWSDCVAKNPRSTIGHFSLAGVAIAENDLPTAEAHLRTAIKLKPDFADAHARLGAVLMLEGKRDEARAELRRALELEPDLTEARHNLSLLGE